MNIAELVEVAIGLVFVWLLLALASMGIQEWIAQLFKFRSKDLEKTIRGMLQEPDTDRDVDPTAHLLKRTGQIIRKRLLEPLWDSLKRFFKGAPPETQSLVTAFYDHPLIRAMARPGERPSYIPSRTFAVALFDLVMNAGTEASLLKPALEAIKDQTADIKPSVEKALTARHAQASNRDAIVQTAMDELEPELDKLIRLATNTEQAEVATRDASQKNLATANHTRNHSLARMRTQLDAFENTYSSLKPMLKELIEREKLPKGLETLDATYQSTAQRTLGSLIEAARATTTKAGETIAAARTSAEQWFDDIMGRLSGQYKRRAYIIGILIGIGLAALLNVDAVVVAQTLWREPTLREAVVAQAEKFQLPDQEGTATEATEGELAEGVTTEEATEGEPSTTSATPSEIIEKTKKELEGLQLPIGWVPADLEDSPKCSFFKPKDPTEQSGTTDEQPKAPSEQPETPDKPYIRGISIGNTCWVPVDQPQDLSRDTPYLWPKIIGWLISGFASAQGAPFWFDVLKKLTNVRLAGTNPVEEKDKENNKKTGS